MILKRTDYLLQGIFGSLRSDQGEEIAKTLEHAYPAENGGYEAKIPAGMYRCVRGVHELKGAKRPFETFEVTGVPGHTGILFHVGNINAESEGCILLGTDVIGNWMLHNSFIAFLAFMGDLAWVDEFDLTVS